MFFKKPIDPYKDLTDEEVEERLEDFRQNKFDRKEQRDMILAALQTFLPPILLGFGGLFLLFYLLLN